MHRHIINSYQLICCLDESGQPFDIAEIINLRNIQNLKAGLAGLFYLIPVWLILQIDINHIAPPNPANQQLILFEKIPKCLVKSISYCVQPLIYVPFFNRVSGAGGFMFRAWWGRM